MTSDRDVLAHLIDPNALELGAYPWPGDAADRVLSSDWLARVKAEAGATALEEAAADEETGWALRSWLNRRADELRVVSDAG